MFLVVFICIVFTSCKAGDHANETKMSMNINGEPWETKYVDQNILIPVEEHGLYDLYIGGSGDRDGFSIRMELNDHQLNNLEGRYPIYNSYSESKSGQVHLLPNFTEFSYNGAYKFDSHGSVDEESVIGYLIITSAELEKSNEQLWYSKLSGIFTSNFEGEMDDGTKKDISITNGYFHIVQLNRSLEFLENESNQIKIRLNGQDWTSDKHSFSIDLTDDQHFYSAVLTGERSDMDMDEDNKGWVIRLFFDIPKLMILESKDHFSGKFSLGPIINSYGQIYFENGEIIDLEAEGDVEFMADFQEVKGKINWGYLAGSFEFFSKYYNEKIQGVFNIETADMN